MCQKRPCFLVWTTATHLPSVIYRDLQVDLSILTDGELLPLQCDGFVLSADSQATDMDAMFVRIREAFQGGINVVVFADEKLDLPSILDNQTLVRCPTLRLAVKNLKQRYNDLVQASVG